MDIKDLQRHWDEFGKTDPLWAILAWHKKGDPDQQWEVDEFFRLGEARTTWFSTSNPLR